jgi:signal transduction histidine kinase
MNLSIKQFEGRSKAFLMAFAVLSVAIIGFGDYITGYEMTFATFYLFPVAVAVWFVGRVGGMVISFLSVCIWLAGDLANGEHFTNQLILVWNATLTFTFYVIVVWILDKLHRLQEELESRVRQRTIALTQEIQERARLEKELLEVSEREQRQIGHDLHDGLGQHLTATAFACQDLAEKLERSPAEASAANHLVKMIEESINLSRTFARGLVPVDVEAEGLMDGFRELADNVSRRFKINCEFECHHPVLMLDTAVSTHLYRIAQEAVTNAIKHGRAKKIVISLVGDPEAIYLKITDDGAGLPAKGNHGTGLGLRIMAHRANMIGADFKIESPAGAGARVTCKLPVTGPATVEQNAA